MMHPKAIPKKSPKIPPKISPEIPSKIPPPPDYAPPPPPNMASIIAFDEAKQRFEFALSTEREKMHTISVQGDEFVFVEHNGKFVFVDFNRVECGKVPTISGQTVQLCDLKMVPGDEIIAATTLEYCVDEQCTTPDSYLCSDDGEQIWIRVPSCKDGWIAASLDQCEWKWFPLSKCSL